MDSSKKSWPLLDIVSGQSVTKCGNLMSSLIAYVEEIFHTPLHKMPPKMREEALAILMELGAFDLRGAAFTLTKRMGVSKPTLYRMVHLLEKNRA